MTVADEPITSQSAPDGTRKVRLVAAVLAVANLLALFLNLLAVLASYDRHDSTDYVVDQDIWFPFMVAAWAQLVVNGILLAAWKRTRAAGLGVLLGSGAAVVLFVGWLVVVVAPAWA